MSNGFLHISRRSRLPPAVGRPTISMTVPMCPAAPLKPCSDSEDSSNPPAAYTASPNDLLAEGKPALSTDASMPAAAASIARSSDDLEKSEISHASTPLNRTCLGTLREMFDYTEGPGMLRCLSVLFVFAVVTGIVVFDRSMHSGAPTSFPADDLRKGYTSGPPERGTINIVSACFATILTCVYFSVHPDVPYVEEETVTKPWWRRWVAWSWRQIKSKKVIWVVLNIVAPELVAYVAVIEFLDARWRRKEMVKYLGVPGDKWTLVHQHFAHMGGFKVPVEGGGDVILRSGYDFHNWARCNPSEFQSINFKQVGMDIEGHSKADWLLKAYTIIQAYWLVVQTLERAIDGLPITELEVTTCAYVACTLCTYIFWWHKPYGVQSHILLHIDPTRRPFWPQKTTPTPFNRPVGYFGMTSDTADNLELPAVVVSGIMGAVIGAIHCTLWNAQFANTNGQLLWRVCCITQIVAPILMSVFLALPGILRRNGKWRSKWHDKAPLVALVPCFFHFCARIVVLILIGYSFWSQPADVYRVADWTWSSFPHIS